MAGSKSISLKFVELSFNEEYGDILPKAYRDSSIVIFVCSYDSQQSLNVLKEKIYPFISEKLGQQNFLPFLIMTKSDILDSTDQVDLHDFQLFAAKIDTQPVMVSAKTKFNISDIINFLRIKILEYYDNKNKEKRINTVESLKSVAIESPKKDSKKEEKSCLLI
ncbi:hypothetical protein TVAG_192630 [Trichomonas vaginalis G3]|uniref:Ras family protein n=1 Tax=Trichomonas vaginalis (strain ATCC PRA-98 / G3) TaxID=412133 RepID=A2DGX7_TRIV3|nr:small GTPase superfamily, Rho family [Trichomonas vaginalis G3]EAY20287.1 hypothetical protein TVAG_192630 [Trichomonas vaginalis G3]KAI5529159.1 small GTPase superfamily, Rho family [Trichomonas vaginalis G3]|eukprot:XP_001581273.1 hypothetical protein [Trichomonas vaginalis G3]